MTVLAAEGDHEAIGALHGATFSAEIRAYTDDRTALSRLGTDLDDDGILAIADAMLPAHKAYDEGLYDEMCAMADAAGITPAQAVIVGGYTDFIDTVRAVAHGTAVEDTCTAVLTPAARTDGGAILAQTWDMHASATPHVFMLDVAANGRPRALVFTTHGTLGQIGMNEAGMAIGINNLTTSDGRIGVTWPFVVRKALGERDLTGAIACILDAPLAGGHNFLVLDAQGRGASIEATSTRTHVWHLGDGPLVHTNHCLVRETMAVEGERPAALQANSVDRLAHATEGLDAMDRFDADGLIELLRDERSICRRPEPPFDYESSGAVVMRPATRDLWACWGNPADNEFEHFAVAGARSA